MVLGEIRWLKPAAVDVGATVLIDRYRSYAFVGNSRRVFYGASRQLHFNPENAVDRVLGNPIDV